MRRNNRSADEPGKCGGFDRTAEHVASRLHRLIPRLGYDDKRNPISSDSPERREKLNWLGSFERL
jgi:hypothetical protein